MVANTSGRSINISDVGSKLRIEFPYMVHCKLNPSRRQVTISRMELVFDGNEKIPGGWRGKIQMVSGIDRKHILYDSIVLPAIKPNGKTPLGPYLAEDIPHDLLHSQDEWQVEFLIIDNNDKEKLLLKNTLELVEGRDSELQLDEKEKDLVKMQEALDSRKIELIKLQQDYQELSRVMSNLDSAIKQQDREYQQKLDDKAEEIRQINKDFLQSTSELRVATDANKVLKNEYEKLQDAYRQATQESEAKAKRIEELLAEIQEETAQVRHLQEDNVKLELVRDRAVRAQEEQESRIDRLQKELEESKNISIQRNATIESLSGKVRELEKEIEQGKDALAQREKIFKIASDKLKAAETKRDEIVAENMKLEGIRRLAEEQNSKIRGLEVELEGNRELLAQRSKQLEEVTISLQKADNENGQLKELMARQEKRIEQQEATIQEINGGKDQAPAEPKRLLALKNEIDQQKLLSEQLDQKLHAAQFQLNQKEMELGELRAQLEKMQQGQVLFGRYELIRRVKQDEAGELNKVYDQKLNRAVSLKILSSILASDRRALQQLDQEAKLLAQLGHIHMIRLYDFVKGNPPYLVTEYVEGKSFRQLIEQRTLFSIETLVDYIEQVCKGLAYAHSKEIFHRNLTPDNIIIADDGFVKIIDFGIADTIRTTIARLTGKTASERLVYISPEQLQGNQKIDSRSDIYSLGIVFFELLSGQPPFTGENVIEQIIKEKPAKIEHVPEIINQILQKCLEKKADKRYPNADELRHELHAASNSNKIDTSVESQ